MYKINELHSKSLVRYFQEYPLVVEGANGGLGLSIAVALSHLRVTIPSLLLTTWNSEPDEIWKTLADKITVIKRSRDIFASNMLSNFFSSEGVANVLYLAGDGQPRKFGEEPLKTINSNVSQLLQYVDHLHKINSFAFSSTTELFTDHSGLINESDTPGSKTQHPRSVYIESKRLGEAIVRNVFSKQSRQGRFVVYRVALAFPPKLLISDTRVLADLMKSALFDGRVVLHGGGSQMRQYQFGPDAALQIISSLANGTSTLYNVSGSFCVSLAELARLVGRITGRPVEIREINVDDSAPSVVSVANSLVMNEGGLSMNDDDSLETHLKAIFENFNPS